MLPYAAECKLRRRRTQCSDLTGSVNSSFDVSAASGGGSQQRQPVFECQLASKLTGPPGGGAPAPTKEPVLWNSSAGCQKQRATEIISTYVLLSGSPSAQEGPSSRLLRLRTRERLEGRRYYFNGEMIILMDERQEL